MEFVQKTGDLTRLKGNLNLILTGNPGTGKTTLARRIHQFYVAHGILSKDNFVERGGVDLKSDHVGGTGPKVEEFFATAMGGTLFLDEAYAIANGGDHTPGGGADAFAKEAVAKMMTIVEDNKGKLMVILAGYKEPMEDFKRLNPGLPRRFPSSLSLPDYTKCELAEIVRRLAAQPDRGMTLEAGLVTHDEGTGDCTGGRLAEFIGQVHTQEMAKFNAELATILLDQAGDRQITRLMKNKRELDADAAADDGAELKPTSTALIRQSRFELTTADFAISANPTLGDPVEKEKAERELADMVGMANAKVVFERMKRLAEAVEKGKSRDLLKQALNLRITGNPGTGKTTLATLYARYLGAYGVLPRGDRVVELNALELKGQYVGQTGPKVKHAVESAVGGCLFIDEAPALIAGGGDIYSGEALRTLLTEVVKYRTDLLVILAGYADKMEELVAADDGLARRFQEVIHLEDYTPADLAAVCVVKARRRGFELAPPLRAPDGPLAALFSTRLPHLIPSQNAGLAEKLVENAVVCQSIRTADSVDSVLQLGDMQAAADRIYGARPALECAPCGPDGVVVVEVEVETAPAGPTEEAVRRWSVEQVGGWLRGELGAAAGKPGLAAGDPGLVELFAEHEIGARAAAAPSPVCSLRLRCAYSYACSWTYSCCLSYANTCANDCAQRCTYSCAILSAALAAALRLQLPAVLHRRWRRAAGPR